MKDRLLTVVLSVVTTVIVMSLRSGRDVQPTAIAAPAEDGRNGQHELIVDRLIVRHELIVSDTGRPWDDGFENHQIPRGMVARSLGAGGGPAGVWVRGRLIKTEI